MNAARARHVLARLAEPWGWCLAAVGVVAATFPLRTDDRPPPADANPPRTAAERREIARLRETAACASGVVVERRAFGPPPATARRALTVEWSGSPSLTPDRVSLRAADRDPLAARHAAWARRTGSPAWAPGAWGWEAWRGYGGETGSGPDGRRPTVFPGEPTWRTVGLSVALPWLVGVPLLWWLARLLAAARAGWGDPIEPGRGRRAMRPWAWTFGLIGAATAFSAGDFLRGTRPDEVRVGFAPLRSPFSAIHPRSLRLTVLIPPPTVSDPTGPVDLSPENVNSFVFRRGGVRASRERLSRVRLRGRTVREGYDLSRIDLSLWYALLPAAGWSAVSLWRSRERTRRP